MAVAVTRVRPPGHLRKDLCLSLSHRRPSGYANGGSPRNQGDIYELIKAARAHDPRGVACCTRISASASVSGVSRPWLIAHSRKNVRFRRQAPLMVQISEVHQRNPLTTAADEAKRELSRRQSAFACGSRYLSGRTRRRRRCGGLDCHVQLVKWKRAC